MRQVVLLHTPSAGINPVQVLRVFLSSPFKESTPGEFIESSYRLEKMCQEGDKKPVGKTQLEVAKSMGTKTSAIGRLKSSLVQKNHSPTLSTLRKYAKAIGYKVEIHLVPDSTHQT